VTVSQETPSAYRQSTSGRDGRLGPGKDARPHHTSPSPHVRRGRDDRTPPAEAAAVLGWHLPTTPLGRPAVRLGRTGRRHPPHTPRPRRVDRLGRGSLVPRAVPHRYRRVGRPRGGEEVVAQAVEEDVRVGPHPPRAHQVGRLPLRPPRDRAGRVEGGRGGRAARQDKGSQGREARRVGIHPPLQGGGGGGGRRELRRRSRRSVRRGGGGKMGAELKERVLDVHQLTGEGRQPGWIPTGGRKEGKTAGR